MPVPIPSHMHIHRIDIVKRLDYMYILCKGWQTEFVLFLQLLSTRTHNKYRKKIKVFFSSFVDKVMMLPILFGLPYTLYPFVSFPVPTDFRFVFSSFFWLVKNCSTCDFDYICRFYNSFRFIRKIYIYTSGLGFIHPLLEPEYHETMPWFYIPKASLYIITQKLISLRIQSF